MIKAGIIGATGYTGIELLQLLARHEKVNVTHVCSESFAGTPITNVYPHLQGQTDLIAEKIDVAILKNDCDVVFIALPHGHAEKIVAPLLAAGVKVIDLGADFRLKNPDDYQNWYQQPPAALSLLQQAVYGLPEKTGQKEKIINTPLLANPGCYPTAILLATLPALQQKFIDPQSAIFDAKSGISGGGRNPTLQNHYCEVAENIIPYQIAGAHRHVPEIEQELSNSVNQSVTIQFTPHLVPMARGLSVTAYFQLTKVITQQDIIAHYREYYQQAPFIRICSHVPQVKHVRGSNYCDLGIYVDTRTQRLIVISVIDNLIKGAAGQAVQNMNLMYQLPETLGLL